MELKLKRIISSLLVLSMMASASAALAVGDGDVQDGKNEEVSEPAVPGGTTVVTDPTEPTDTPDDDKKDPEPQPDEPTPAPDPQPEPEPTPDPEPTPTPEPTPDPEPIPEPEPQPEPQPEKPEFIPPVTQGASLTDKHIAYMKGVGEGKFSPDSSVTWAQMATIIYNLLVDKNYSGIKYDYSAMDSGKWYYTAMTVLASKGVLPADGSTIDPMASISRQDFVKLLVTVAGADKDAQCSFTDLDEYSPYYVYIATASSNGWINGFPDGGFHPEENLTRGQTAVVFNKMLNRSFDVTVFSGDVSSVRTFTDVPQGRYYYNDILEATIEHEYTRSSDSELWTDFKRLWPVTYRVNGTETTEYVYEGDSPVKAPKKTASGETITVWFVTGQGVEIDPSKVVVEANNTYSFTAYWAPKLITAHNQYVEGLSGGKFGPDATLTRAQTCQMLYNLLAQKYRGGFGYDFTDVYSSDWYYAAVTTLASLYIIPSGGEFRPNDMITRGEFAGIISALTSKTSDNNPFTDVDSENENYDAIITAVAKGWINGYPDGTFKPEGTLTRAEAVTVFNKILGRTGDKATEKKMDSRFTFTDLPKSHWAYNAVMEAATTHSYTASNGAEKWSEYSHKTAKANWENSDSVVNAAKIVTSYQENYTGDYTHNYNIDYSQADKESFVSGYSSSTNYLVWVSRACQKVYLFTGSKGNWKLSKTFICATGKKYASPTPECVTSTTYKQDGWYTDHYTCSPVVRFMSGSGFAFHSRLYVAGHSKSYFIDDTIGMPASAGCVRMLTPDVTYFYNYLPSGSRVIVSK